MQSTNFAHRSICDDKENLTIKVIRTLSCGWTQQYMLVVNVVARKQKTCHRKVTVLSGGKLKNRICHMKTCHRKLACMYLIKPL